MIKNLASYRVGDRLIIRVNDYSIHTEVRVEEKAPRLMKITALDDAYFKKDQSCWLGANQIIVVRKLKRL